MEKQSPLYFVRLTKVDGKSDQLEKME